MKIIPLSEGSFTIDSTKSFIPFNASEDDLQERSKGSLLVEIQPFVVVTSSDVLLLDAGLGYTLENGVQQLQQNLMDKGINSSEITKVLMSHLHKDHAGGISVKNEQGEFECAFPQATFYIQEKELEYALDESNTSYQQEELQWLKQATNVKRLNGDGVIDGYISYSISAGHCPYHQVFKIVDGGETYFFGGDEAPQLQQMKTRFVAKYDNDGKKAMQLRQQWWEEGREKHWSFLFYHDIKEPIYRAD